MGRILGPEEDELRNAGSMRRSMFVRLRLEQGEELYVHKARNVTSEGLFIDAPVPLSRGTRVQIEFRAADDSIFTCDAQVEWTTDMVGVGAKAPHPGFGVVFVGLEPAQRRALGELVGG